MAFCDHIHVIVFCWNSDISREGRDIGLSVYYTSPQSFYVYYNNRLMSIWVASPLASREEIKESWITWYDRTIVVQNSLKPPQDHYPFFLNYRDIKLQTDARTDNVLLCIMQNSSTIVKQELIMIANNGWFLWSKVVCTQILRLSKFVTENHFLIYYLIV